MSASVRLGVDVGGTFTDVVAVDEATGEWWTTKTPTDVYDPTAGVVAGVQTALRIARRPPESVRVVIHATTLITNAIIEGKGAKVGLLTTSGFEDVLEIGRQIRHDLYDLSLRKPEPLVPRPLRKGVRGRVLADGSEAENLDEGEVRAELRELNESGVQAVAVCLLHSYANEKHERLVDTILESECPGLYRSVSVDVAPVVREYERTSTTVANAFVGPMVSEYLGRLEDALGSIDLRAPVHVMISDGGASSIERARKLPISLVESGPAAGVVATAELGKRLSAPKLLSFDMGGTTAKVGFVDSGVPARANTLEVARLERLKRGSGYPLLVRTVDMIEIGAGGGSIARIDELGLLKVGPESAAASPGPACYGRGGEAPTVTDADLLLGYIDPTEKIGGALTVQADLAESAIEHAIAAPLGMRSRDAAISIYRVVTNNMATALRTHAAERGRDYRNYALLAFGGAGPVHAFGLAMDLRMRRVICPPGSGVLSALGLVVAPLAVDIRQSRVRDLDILNSDEIEDLFRTLGRAMDTEVDWDSAVAEGHEFSEERFVEMQYVGQGYQLEVKLPNGPLPDAEWLEAAFTREYTERYRVGPGVDAACRTVGWRLRREARPRGMAINGLAGRNGQGRDGGQAIRHSRSVYLPDIGEFSECPVYDRTVLPVGWEIEGPAMIQEPDSAVVVGVNSRAYVDEFLNVIVEIDHKA